jgi:hypothetical protein
MAIIPPMINIGLLMFIIVVIGNVAALLIDIMLINNGVSTISEVAQQNRLWAVIFVLFQELGAIGLGLHLF